jgi:hypothetical protein
MFKQPARVVHFEKWSIGSEALVQQIAHPFREGIELYMKLKAKLRL